MINYLKKLSSLITNNKIKIKNEFYNFFCVYIFIFIFLLSLKRLFRIDLLISFLNKNNIDNPIFHTIKSLYKYHYVDPSSIFQLNFLPILFLVYLMLLFSSIKHFQNLNKNNTESLSNEEITSKNINVSLIFIFICLIIKEFLYPYYFVQSDNYSQFFPKILLSLNMLFSGVFPFIDFYQHFGAPIFEIGTYAFLEPNMIASYLLANLFFSNIYATLDIYSILSILLGAFCFGHCLKILKIKTPIAISAIISYSLAGYFLINGRCWYYVLSLSFYMSALLFFFLYALKKETTWKWFLGIGFIRTCFFYSGNIQFFIYICLLEFISYFYLFIIQKKYSLFGKYFSSLLFTLGLSCPLLLSQLIFNKNCFRGIEGVIADGGVPFDGFISAFFPYPITKTSHPLLWEEENFQYMTNMYHIGFFWMSIFFLSIFSYIKFKKTNNLPLLFLSTILLILSTGWTSILYSAKLLIPFIYKFRLAYKIYPIAILTIILFVSIKVNGIFFNSKTKKIISSLLLISIIITTIEGVFFTDTSYVKYSDKPYPRLEQNINKFIKKNDFVYSITIPHLAKKNYVTLLSANFGNLYNKKTVAVYDPLLPTSISNPDRTVSGFTELLPNQFKKYGVTKIILQKNNNRIDWYKHATELSDLKEIFQNKDFIIYSTGIKPWILKPIKNNLSYKLNIINDSRNLLKVKITSSKNEDWIFHNEYRNGYFYILNGKKFNMKKSKNNWCKLYIPSGENIIEIKYEPPHLRIYFFIGALFLLLSIFLFKKLRLI